MISGAVFSPTVLDISDDDLIRHFTEVWQQVLVVYDILLDTVYYSNDDRGGVVSHDLMFS